MKTIWIAVAALAAWLVYKKLNPPVAKPTVHTTSTLGNADAWFPGWNGFTNNQLANTTKSINDAFSSIASLSNVFGRNDGGTNPGVSTGGSQNGGLASTGGGVGLPVTTQNFTDFLTSTTDQSTDSLLNGYSDFTLN